MRRGDEGAKPDEDESVESLAGSLVEQIRASNLLAQHSPSDPSLFEVSQERFRAGAVADTGLDLDLDLGELVSGSSAKGKARDDAAADQRGGSVEELAGLLIGQIRNSNFLEENPASGESLFDIAARQNQDGKAGSAPDGGEPATESENPAAAEAAKPGLGDALGFILQELSNTPGVMAEPGEKLEMDGRGGIKIDLSDKFDDSVLDAVEGNEDELVAAFKAMGPTLQALRQELGDGPTRFVQLPK
mmetsp:Transcript_16729/g.25970  ORF Transcript_16729/g.25970 Transcript_16729/m.25970 type:complete len:246 (-) Transcript_16729:27-764(-)